MAFRSATALTEIEYSGSCSVSVPSGVQDDDIIILFAFGRRASVGRIGSFTWPTGFTEIASCVIASYRRVGVAWKRASSESGSYTVSVSAASESWLAALAYSGRAASGSPVDVYSDTAYTTNNTTIRAASMTTTEDGDDILWLGFADNSTTTIAGPSGMNARVDMESAKESYCFSVCDLLNQSAGATGDKDGTAGSATTLKHAFMVALLPPLSTQYNQTCEAVSAAVASLSTNRVTLAVLSAVSAASALLVKGSSAVRSASSGASSVLVRSAQAVRSATSGAVGAMTTIFTVGMILEAVSSAVTSLARFTTKAPMALVSSSVAGAQKLVGKILDRGTAAGGDGSAHTSASNDDSTYYRSTSGYYAVEEDFTKNYVETYDDDSEQSWRDSYFYLRFPNVQIPRGATVTAASLDLVVDVYNINECVILGFSALLIDDYVAPTGPSELFTKLLNIPHSSYSYVEVPYSDVGEKITLDHISFKIRLQDIVNRPGWEAGNAIGFDISPCYARYARFASFDHPTYDPPTLHFTYTGGGVQASPTLSAGRYLSRVYATASSAVGYVVRKAQLTMPAASSLSSATVYFGRFLTLAASSLAHGTLGRAVHAIRSTVSTPVAAVGRLKDYLVLEAVSAAVASLTTMFVFLIDLITAASTVASLSRTVGKVAKTTATSTASRSVAITLTAYETVSSSLAAVAKHTWEVFTTTASAVASLLSAIRYNIGPVRSGIAFIKNIGGIASIRHILGLVTARSVDGGAGISSVSGEATKKNIQGEVNIK